MYTIDAKQMDYRKLNALMRELVASGEDHISLENVNGHRYIACGMTGSITLEITGTGGNNLGAYMAGPEIRVKGNVQDCAANTMNYGSMVVEGRAGDILGYGMSGGEIFIKGDVGSRTGIHLKGLGGKVPTIVIGGTAGDFLGEYMAAGNIIVLGIGADTTATGRQCGVGMHGGAIYVNADTYEDSAGAGVAASKPTAEDLELIRYYAERFADYFGYDSEAILRPGFIKLSASGLRPYGTMYVGT